MFVCVCSFCVLFCCGRCNFCIWEGGQGGRVDNDKIYNRESKNILKYTAQLMNIPTRIEFSINLFFAVDFNRNEPLSPLFIYLVHLKMYTFI